MLDAMFDGLKRKRRAAWNRNVAEVPLVVQEPLVWLENHGTVLPMLFRWFGGAGSVEENLTLAGGLSTQGLFRVTGQLADIRKVKALYDKDFVRDARGDVHNVGGVVKLFLQEMEDPLLTAELYLAWLEALDLQLSCLRRLANLLPPGNKAIFLRLLKFFKENEPQTKMGANNIAIVFAPSLLRPVGNDPYKILSDGPKAQKVLEMCIKHEEMFAKKAVAVPEKEAEKAKLTQFERTLKMGTIRLARALVEEQKKMLEEEEDNAAAAADDADWPPRRRLTQPAAASPKLNTVFEHGSVCPSQSHCKNVDLIDNYRSGPAVPTAKGLSPRVSQLDKPLPALPNPSPNRREPEKTKPEREERHKTDEKDRDGDRERKHRRPTGQVARTASAERSQGSPSRTASPARQGTAMTAEEIKQEKERKERKARQREREKRRAEREKVVGRGASSKPSSSPDRTEQPKKAELKKEKDDKDAAPKLPERTMSPSSKGRDFNKQLPPLPSESAEKKAAVVPATEPKRTSTDGAATMTPTDTAEKPEVAAVVPQRPSLVPVKRTGSVPSNVLGAQPPALVKREGSLSTGDMLPALSLSTPGSDSSVRVHDEGDSSEVSLESDSSDEEQARPPPSAAESQSPGSLRRQRSLSLETSSRARGSVIRESARRAKEASMPPGSDKRRLSRVETVMEMLVAPRPASPLTPEEQPPTPPPKALSDLVEGIMTEGIEDMSSMLENMSLDEVAQLEGALSAASKAPDAVHGDDEWEWSESDASSGKDSR